jgi:hypothetical protein
MLKKILRIFLKKTEKSTCIKGGVALLLARLDPSLINKTKNPILDLVFKFKNKIK